MKLIMHGGSVEPVAQFFRDCAQNHVPNWEVKLQQVSSNLEMSDNDLDDPQPAVEREKWMMLSDFHNSNVSFTKDFPTYDSFVWHQTLANYTAQQVGEMPVAGLNQAKKILNKYF